jgi:hypothetical protein
LTATTDGALELTLLGQLGADGGGVDRLMCAVQRGHGGGHERVLVSVEVFGCS